VLPAAPSKLTTGFAAHKATLSASAKSALRVLAKKLIAGASVTVTGYAKGNAALARGRANAVATYLKSLVHVKVTLKTVTRASVNEVTVTTSQQ
jgi:outer membrane protein OmpA-like peptidoglycan-associated protein